MDPLFPEDGIRVGGPVSQLSVSLRIAGESLDPDEITHLFGLEPRFSARKGDRIHQGGRTRTQRVGIWSYALNDEPSPESLLDDAITALLSRFPADPAVWADLGRRYDLDVFCGLFMGSVNPGTGLQPETLRLLAYRGLALDLDIYGPIPRDDAA